MLQIVDILRITLQNVANEVIMKASEVVAYKTDQAGISIAKLAQLTGIRYELLRRSLNGKRPLKADELVKCSKELKLEISDFINAS